MPIRVGIIGLSAAEGAWAQTHLTAIRQLPDHYLLVALATSKPETAAAAGKAFGIPLDKCYSSAEALAQDPDVDLVVVSVKVSLHKQVTLPAIAAGKDVFLEWPIANGSEEVDEVVEAAKLKGIKTLVGLQGLQNAGIQKVKTIVDSGAIGRVVSTNFSASFTFLINLMERIAFSADISQGANIVTIFAALNLDVLIYVLGAELEYLQANIAQTFKEISIVDNHGGFLRRAPSSVPDSLSIHGVLQNQVFVTWNMTSTTASNYEYITWLIHGDEGTLKVETPFPWLTLVSPKISLYKDGKWEEVQVPAITPVDPFVNIYTAFAEGRSEGYVDFERGATRHRMVEAIWKSAKNGTRESYL